MRKRINPLPNNKQKCFSLAKNGRVGKWSPVCLAGIHIFGKMTENPSDEKPKILTIVDYENQ